MSCPTCSHTMQSLGNYFWCPRCGTIKGERQGYIERPALIPRIRMFAKLHRFTPDSRQIWETQGIPESIGTEEGRPHDPP